MGRNMLPREPKHTWQDILVAIYNEWGQHTPFTSRDLADLLGMGITDASQRLRYALGWGAVKHIETRAHNQRVYELSKYGASRAKSIKEAM